MRVLITGGAGYVGSVLARLLLRQGCEVRVLDCLLYGGQSLLGLYPEEKFSFVRGDIRSKDLVKEALAGSEAIVHLAAIVGDPACSRQPQLAREVNLEASLQLFEMAQSCGVQRFVFASTCSNYGRSRDPSAYLTEESELRPVSLYAETKVAVEKTLLSAPFHSGDAVAATVLRFATIFGLSPRMRFDLTVNEFTMELMRQKSLQVFGAQFWRPYLHVRDAARAIALVLGTARDRIAGKVFNVGDSTQNYPKGELVKLICAALEDPTVEIRYVHKEEDPRDYRVSFEKIKNELGFQITRTVQEGVREIIEVISQGVITDFDNTRFTN